MQRTNHHHKTKYTSHEVTARTGVPANRSSFAGWQSAVGPSGRTKSLSTNKKEDHCK